MFHLDENEDSQGEFIGMVEVGLDYDQPFIDDLKARNNADYKMWVTFEAAEVAGLGPGEDAPDAPIAELFYYAATDPTPLSIPKEVYRRVIHDRRPEIQSVSVAGEELTVLLAPMLAYGGRIIGVLEIRMVQTGPLSSMTQTRNNALILVGGLALLMLTVIGLTINLIVLRPLRHLANVAQSQLEGDMSARVQLSTRDEFGQLGLVFNTLTESLDNVLQGLESIVDERTHDLARRTAYQAASAEVSRAAASILDIDQLIRRMVELIRERFEFHYVGLFLVDETGEWAVLRDGTGESGQALLARGLRVRVGEGMIGWSIASAQSRVAAQASSDAQRLTLPELPDTRTEAALPLRSRGQVLGALSIEHDQADVFDQDTVTVLQTMADQIAVALDNARLLAANRETMQAERQAYGDLSRDAWAQMLRARGAWGFRYTKQASGIASQVVPAEGAWRSEMVQATQMGQSIVGDSTGEQTLAIPLKVREQVVGVLSFCKSEDSEDSNGETWTTGEIDLLEALVEQLSMALESARLYQDTQLHAAREQLTREITDEMRRNVDVEAVLQAAVTSLGQALGAPRTYVRLTIDEGRSAASVSPENGGANQYQEPAQGPSEETLLRWASLPGAKEPAPSPPKGDERNES